MAYDGPVRATILLEADNKGENALARDWFARWTKALTGMSRGGCGCCVVSFIVEGPSEAMEAIPPAIRGGTPDDQTPLRGPVENPYPPRAKDRRRQSRQGRKG